MKKGSIKKGLTILVTILSIFLFNDNVKADVYGPYDYGCTNSIQSFTAPVSGVYKLEVWGAQGQGQNMNAYDNAGGYSTGNIRFTEGETVYVVVGCLDATTGVGGFNGGGSGKYGGGGATHISRTNTLLRNTPINDLLIAAGGGGGQIGHFSYGGGYIGGGKVTSTLASGGTQTAGGAGGSGGSGYLAGSSGGYGYGADSPVDGGGGGGGYYGGGSGGNNNKYTNSGTGGGGSGYIGNPALTDKHMFIVCTSGNSTCYESDDVNTKTIAQPSGDNSVKALETPTSDKGKRFQGAARISLVQEVPDSRLKTLSVTGTYTNQTLISSPGDQTVFNVSVNKYDLSVNINLSTVSLLATVAYQSPISIPSGNSSTNITVTASDGSVTIYTINFSRQPNEVAGINNLTYNGNQVPGFDANILDYTINVSPFDDEKTFTIGASLYSNEQTITGLGTFNHAYGSYDYPVTVTAEDGTTTRTYTIHVVKPHTTRLKEIELDGYSLSPSFSRDILNYNIAIGTYTNSVGIKKMIPYDESVDINSTGHKFIRFDQNGLIKITVTHPDAEETVYTINALRDGLVSNGKWGFGCTKQSETWVVPETRYYILEAWGAQGGNNGGRGGYTNSKVKLTEGQEIYVTVGCQGQNGSKTGYNGGGGGTSGGMGTPDGGAGGGATHFAINNNLGELRKFNKNKSDVLLVAGGGGGGNHKNSYGGAGGGLNGISGDEDFSGTGGTQSAGGSGKGWIVVGSNGTFGNGGSASNVNIGFVIIILPKYSGGGGGGGWYGGGGGDTSLFGNSGGGGGGSSYINTNSGLKTKATTTIDGNSSMPTYQGGYTIGKTGDGYATITQAEYPSNNNNLKRLSILATDETTLNETKKNYTPVLDGTTTDYYVHLESNETKVDLDAEVEDGDAEILSGLGTYFVDGSEKTVTITVKADNGDVKEYKIHFDRDLDNNSKPLDIKIEGLVPNYCSQSNLYCNLTPTFNPDTNEYEMLVPGRIDTLKFVVEKAHKNQSATGDGSVYLAEEENVINIRVTSEDGTSSTTYRYVITRDLDGSPYLETINVLDPDTDLGFSKNVFDYYITVPNEYDKYVDNLVNEKNNSLENTLQLYIKPESNHTSYVLSGNGNLNFGNNKLTITTTARNGEVAIYNITVYRSKDISTLLSTLEVYNGSELVELIPEYNKLKYNYRGEVDETVETVNIVATPEDNRSTVTGDGIQVLSAGKNRFIVTITSPAGDSESYVINITKKKDNNSYLSSLVVKNGEEELTYTPEFNKETYEYELQVESDVNKLDIIGTPESDRASVINLTDTVIKEGNNKKTIYCYAEDGTYKTYTVNITKKSPLANRLSDIKVYDKDNNELEYTPEFNPETFVYSLTVDNDIDSVKVEGTKTNPKSVLKGNGTYSLEVGMNPIHLELMLEGEETKSYTILITRKPSSNAYLKSITTSEGTLSPTFGKYKINYTLDVDNDVTSIKVDSEPEVITTSVTGNGEYELTSGENTITLVTTAEDGETSKTYTIKVNKSLSDNNNIKTLILKEAGLNPEFDPSTTSYDAYVSNEVTSGTFVVELEDPNASYEIIGNENFVVGENEVTIRVTSESNKTKDYVVTINRQEESTLNYLASLTVSEGTLTPAFNKEVQYYEVEVENNIETDIIDATPEYASSTVTGTGVKVLEKGKNVCVVRVTDKNGIIRDYQVVITRKGNNEARLKTLELNSEILSPAFDKDTYSYSTSTASTSLEFNKIETIDENATYEVKNNVFTDEGEYTVTIEVTAEDGVTKKNYDITVTKRQSDNNNLSYLGVEGYEIVPEYDKGIIIYTLTVPSDVNMVNVIAKAEDSNATITGDGLNRLDVGENNVFVKVTSQSGKTKTYTITITREGSSNNKLKALDVLNGTFSPTYSNNIYGYNSEIPYDENIADIYYELEDENAKVSIEGNEDLKEGLNEVVMTVTATNGDVRVIELHVTKKPPVSSLLKTLKVVGYETTPEFNSYRMNYEVDVNNETDDLDLIIETLDPNATYVVSDTSLEVGSNEVTIEVTASDGVTKSTYTISVNRDEYANNYLLYLFTNRGDLTPTFNATTNEYSINVANDIEDIDIIARAENTTATVTTPNPTINTDTYDGLVGRFALQTGENKIHILVTTEEASTRRYIITVNRAKKDDNYLKTLKVYHEGNAYDLVPEFNKETTSYTVSVPTNVENVVITGTPHDETATVTGLGEKQVHFGANTFPVVVTAENGSKRTYTLVINRALSSNNNLFLLEPSSGELDPVFDADITEYNLELDESVETLYFDYIAEDKYSTVTGAEEQVVPNGKSTRNIVVTAENGNEKTYVVNVNKIRKDIAYLDDLYVVNYPFIDNNGDTVTFNKETYNYNIKVPYSKTTLSPNEVVYESEDDNATVEKDSTINLSTTGDNVYKVKVTAQDGFTTNIYTIHIEREKNDVALLSSFEPKVGSLTTTFISNVFNYVWDLPENKEITPLDVIYELMDKNSSATLTESVTYVEGENNAFEITVTSENKEETNTYRFVLQVTEKEKPYLKSLSVDVGLLEPEFNKETYSYDVYENADVESVTISAEPEDDTSIVSGTGTVTLDNDYVRREITVTGTNGEINVYVVNIHKVVTTNDYLEDLGLNGLDKVTCASDECTLSPAFDKDVTSYNIKVPNEYDELDVYYKLKNDHQSVEITVDGSEYTKGMYLGTGDTIVTVKVYNGLKELLDTYTMTIERVYEEVEITTPDGPIVVPKNVDYELPSNTVEKADEDAATVTFKYHNGNEDTTSKVKKHYEPNGWLINGVHHDDGEIIKPTEDIELVPDYIETFEGAEFPSNPTMNNRAFTGWFDQEYNGNKYTSYAEEEDITLHAQWTYDYVTIIIPGEDPIKIPKGDEFELPENTIAKNDDTITVTFKYQNGVEDTTSSKVTHYTPNGWLANGKHYDDGDIITPYIDITLVPDYTETVDLITLPEPTWIDHLFLNWNSRSDGKGTNYTNESINKLENDTDVYAIWSLENVTISFNTHGAGDIDSIVKAYNAKYGTLPTPTKEGFNFDGWYKEETYENKVSSETKATEDVTLHAKWVEDTSVEDGEFEFTRTYGVYTAPETGLYKLETWGAQGAMNGTQEHINYGGYGAYSTGIVSLNKDDKIYIIVGENPSGMISGFPNGGGGIGAAGGGSTHIATKPVLIKNASDDQGSLLIISGGGAGAGKSTVVNWNSRYGSAGGIKGNDGYDFLNNNVSNNIGTGGSQSAGGQWLGNQDPTANTSGSFGQGGRATVYVSDEIAHYGGNGGGGYYGGGGSSEEYAAAGGGSSYIGNPLLISTNDLTKHMTCYECMTSDVASTKTISTTCHSSDPIADCAKEGNGYAKVTYIPETHTVTYPDGSVEVYDHNTIVNLDSNESTLDDEELAQVEFNYNDWKNTTLISHVIKRYTPNGFTINGIHYDDLSTLVVDEDKVITYSYEEEIVGAEFPENPEKQAYIFDGWYTEDEGGEKVEYYDGEEDIELYGHWIPETVTITYPEAVDVVPIYNDYYRTRYNNYEKDPDVATVTFKLHNGEDDIISEVKQYYYKDGWIDQYGDTWSSDVDYYIDKDLTLSPYYYEDWTEEATFPDNPTREGYVFKGWYDQEEGGNKYTEYSEFKDITLHAQWTDGYVTITTPDGPIEVPRGDEFELPYNSNYKDPDTLATVTFKYHNGEEDTTSEVKKQYTPNGWLIDGIHFDSYKVIKPTKDITLVPDYTEYIVGAEFPSDPFKDGEKSNGWFDQEEGGNIYFSYNKEEDITLHAQYGKATFAYLNKGQTINKKLKNKTGEFRKATLEEYDLVKNTMTNSNIISTNDSPLPVYLWESGDDILYYSEANTIYMHRYSDEFFLNTSFSSINVSDLNTSRVENMMSMFSGCSSLTSLDLSNFDTSNVTYMSFMFSGCTNLTNIDVSSFDTRKVVNMNGMFQECSSLTSIDLSNFNTSNVKEMNNMFRGCTSLTSIDLSHFDTSKVEQMESMFSECTSLTSIDLSNLDVSKVRVFNGMFKGCTNLETITWSNYVNRKAHYFDEMFMDLPKIEEIDISNINVKNTIAENTGDKYYQFRQVFNNSPSLRTIYATKDAWPIEIRYSYNGENVFVGDTSLVGGEGTVYDSNNVDYQYALVDDPDNNNPGYFTDASTIKEQHTVTYHYKDGDIVEHYNHNSILKLDVNDNEVSLDSLGTITFKYHDGVTEDTKARAFAITYPNGWIVNDVHYDDEDYITIDEDKDIYYDSTSISDIDDFPTPTREGYEFLGWFTEEEGGDEVTSYEGEEDITLHAHWEFKMITITTPDGEEEVPYGSEYTLGVNDILKGSEKLSDVTFKYHDEVTTDLVRHVTKQYTSNGWLVNGVHYDDESSFIATEDATIEPDYTESVVGAPFPEDPVREDYNFLGWFTEETGGEKVESYEGEEDIILHAQWTMTLPTGMELDTDDITLVVGQVHQIEVTFIPDGTTDTLTYTGYDEDKISVVDGLVTGLSKGETTITVGTENTDVTKTITVTVISDKLESEVYDVREADPDNNKDRIVVGAEPQTTVSDYKDNLLNPNEYLKVYDLEGNELDDAEVIKTGQVIKLVYGSTVMDEAYIVIRGDVNKDGFVNMADYMLIQNHYLEMEEITDYASYVAADVMENDVINMQDTMKLLNYYTEQIDTLND